MGQLTTVRAWANNEVAYVAWDVDGAIANCLGFDVTRISLNADGSVARRPDGTEDRVRVASWVPFKGQTNPNWLAQDSGVWPVQKMSWRDLTLRKKRDSMTRRPDEVLVRYEVRPVGDLKPGLEAIPDNNREFQFIVKRDAHGKPILDEHGHRTFQRVRAYEGAKRPLGYLGPAMASNDLLVTSRRGLFRSTFTNGILAAQWLRNVLNEDGVIDDDELITKISTPGDPHRNYLAGDVIPLMHDFLERPGEFFLALYELDDKELVDLLVANANRIHVILSNSGANDAGEWDARNQPARKRLVDASVDIQHRMFNNSIQIGHNKFVVHVPSGGAPRAVLTGSTNWTSTGLAGQTNNALLVEDDGVAGVFLDYWNRMKADVIPLPSPMTAAMNASRQGAAFRASNVNGTAQSPAGAGALTIWFSPNRPEREKPTPKNHPAPTPPDLTDVYHRMRLAREAILFLAFYPGQRGKDCIIGEAIDIGQKDRSLIVLGAVSSPQAMPNYVPSKKDESGEVIEGDSPATFEDVNVSVVRAARIDDRSMLAGFGKEVLTANNGIGAIIHDKIIVIDPRADDCTVILGSHNLGFKASYSNDENFLIVTGNKPLAEAYAVHILDVFDHYRFRAIQQDQIRQGKSGWSGFLETTDHWQDGYVAHTKGAIMRYFARP